MNTGIDQVKDFERYLKSAPIDLEADDFTRRLISQYYEEEALRKRWKGILGNKYEYSLNTPMQAEASIPTTASSKYKLLGPLLAMAACVLFAWLFWPTVDHTSSDPVAELLSEHYANPHTRDLLKGSSLEPALRSRAYNFYQNKEYQKTIPLLEEVINEGSQEEADHFFLGLSYLYNKQAEQAIPSFQYLLAQPLTRYKDSATWYLALALTAANNYTAARPYLRQVATWDGNSGKRKLAAEAERLLKVLDEE